ncbi:ClC family H(+)/Cl(-) exchange transporter [Proteocatella sphenisci]|uniref:ClC family H(+)/Cl(-) exchange transporter n=1 Tax=Proteocatella sphenisci TaxID=181070 RepID=UPI0004B87CDC|nr:ClC family H(+)/Cl(-) exchange transporter [Proteocatella sphenisci]
MKKNNYKEAAGIYSSKLSILYKSIITGFLAGAVVILYRLILIKAEHLSFEMYAYVREHIIYIPLALALLGCFGYITGILVSKYKLINGSGIPQVKGIIMGYFEDSWFSTLVSKFIGGVLSIFAGLSLGREGPSIQLGACVAQGVGNKLAKSRTEKKILIASGASAGLSAAFNAPLAGTIFAMEEIYKYFSPVILLSAMASAMTADFLSKMVFGLDPVFSFNVTSVIPLSGYWMLLILGIALGFMGAFYNKMLIFSQHLYKKIPLLSAKTKLLMPFLLAGILGVVFPLALGGGHVIVEQLNPSTGITLLVLILCIKFVFSMISFGSGAPGGIFFPLLIMGALIGCIFGNIAISYAGFNSELFYNFIILAMAGYFTAIVRAPITGIVLLVEMTGSFTHLLSLTVVCIVAYVVADLLESPPVYESLLESQIAKNSSPLDKKDDGRKITMEMVVHYGSSADGKTIKELEFPSNCLLIAIRRRGGDIIPNGNTIVMPEDSLVFITDQSKESCLRELMEKTMTA